MQAEQLDLVSYEEIIRQANELKEASERVTQLRDRMDAAPSDMDIEARARRDLADFNRTEVARFEQSLERAQKELDMLARSSSALMQEDPAEHADLVSRAMARVGQQQRGLDRARARVASGFDGAPEAFKTGFFDDAESRLMEDAGHKSTREQMFMDYDEARADLDRRMIEVDELRARYDLQQRQARMDQQEAERVRRETAAAATAGLSTDTRAVLDPSDIVERELPPGATVTRGLTKEEESIERKAAAIAHGDQAARDATVTARGPSSAADLNAQLAQRMGQRAEAEPVAQVAEQPAAEPVQASPSEADESSVKRSRAERYSVVPETSKVADPDLYDADEIKEAKARQAAAAASGETPPIKSSGSIKNADAKMNPQSATGVELAGYKQIPAADGHKVEYREIETDRLAFVDEGDQVRMTKASEARETDMRAALTLAASKFETISISGTTEFRDRATDQAARMGLADRIANQELRRKGMELQEKYAAEQAARTDELSNSLSAGPKVEEQLGARASASEPVQQPVQEAAVKEEPVQAAEAPTVATKKEPVQARMGGLKIVPMSSAAARKQETKEEARASRLQVLSMSQQRPAGVQTIEGTDSDLKIISMANKTRNFEAGADGENVLQQGGGAIRARP